MKENAPIYNLKAVIHETGLTPATLRAWERRYGLLKPQRSPGGHRLYTEDDIEMLKWLVARLSDGLTISHAVQMWRNQEEKLSDRVLTTPTIALPVSDAGEDILDQLRNSWCAACMEFNEPAAELALAQALAIAAPEVVCTQLLLKGLAQLGEGWYSGTVSIQQEHFASALAVRRLNALFAVAPAPIRPYRLLAACPPGEAHDLALLMLAFILRWHGWEVIYLGANTPLARLDTTLRSIAPRMVLSVAQTLPGAAALSELAGYVNAQSIPLAYGGGIFSRIPALIDRIPGYFLGEKLGAAPQMIDDLFARWPSHPVPQPLNPAYAAALAGFKAKETQMIASVNQALQNSGIPPRNVEEANIHFTKAIASALALGNIGFLDHSAGWLKGLMENYGASPALAVQYYQAYHMAVRQHLGSQAGPILAWFTQVETAA